MYRSSSTDLQRQKDSIIRNIDWLTIILYLVLISLGWLSIYSATMSPDADKIMSNRATMQLVWFGSSFLIAFVILKFDVDIYEGLAYQIYIVMVLVLVLTIFIAPDIKGSRSWIVITDSIRFQPAEFSKFAVALALAKFMSQYRFKLMELKNIIFVGLIIFIPFVLIILQQETGSALVLAAFIFVLYREGLPTMILIAFLLAIILFIIGLKYSEFDLGYTISLGEYLSMIIISAMSILILINSIDQNKSIKYIGAILLLYYVIITLLWNFNILNLSLGLFSIIGFSLFFLYLIFMSLKKWNVTYFFVGIFMLASMAYVSSIDYIFTDVLQSHQQQRIKVILGIEDDPLGVGYNQNQAKISIGSGGFNGKGFMNATQTKLKYVPEHDTDFIFCTVGEEWGFIGSILVLFIFLVFILRILYLSEKQKKRFSRIYGYSVASIFFFHIFINIGMVTGITPVIGIPLPFFSYGGSSAWAFTILLFIFLKLDMYNKKNY